MTKRVHAKEIASPAYHQRRAGLGGALDHVVVASLDDGGAVAKVGAVPSVVIILRAVEVMPEGRRGPVAEAVCDELLGGALHLAADDFARSASTLLGVEGRAEAVAAVEVVLGAVQVEAARSAGV
eukprot:COSAG04_NODE_1189_length_7838_cov_2.304820_1_plen_124_part_10